MTMHEECMLGNYENVRRMSTPAPGSGQSVLDSKPVGFHRSCSSISTLEEFWWAHRSSGGAPLYPELFELFKRREQMHQLNS